SAASCPVTDSDEPYIGELSTARPPSSTKTLSVSLACAIPAASPATTNTCHVPRPIAGIASHVLGMRRSSVAPPGDRDGISRAPEKGPIKIGLFGPLTGNVSQPGKDMVDGFTLFCDETGNKVAGREVKIIIEDSDPEPAGALTKVRRLVEPEQVHTVAGGLLAATGYALPPYLEQNKVPTLYPLMAPDDITQRKPARWVVRTSFAGSQVTH